MSLKGKRLDPLGKDPIMWSQMYTVKFSPRHFVKDIYQGDHSLRNGKYLHILEVIR